MDVELLQSLELDTNAVYARISTSVKFVRIDLNMNIHLSKLLILIMYHHSLVLLLMMINQAPTPNSHLTLKIHSKKF